MPLILMQRTKRIVDDVVNDRDALGYWDSIKLHTWDLVQKWE